MKTSNEFIARQCEQAGELVECIRSGQASAEQVEAHYGAGEIVMLCDEPVAQMPPLPIAAWLRSSNISNQITGVFLIEDTELRTERLEPLCKVSDAQAHAAQQCALLAAKLAVADEYAIALQRAIEMHCYGEKVLQATSVKCPYHAEKLDKFLTSTSTQPSAVEPTAQPVAGDAERLDFMQANPRLNLREYKRRWSMVGFTSYEYETYPTVRESIDAAIAAGGGQ